MMVLFSGTYLFLLGLASGLTLFLLSAYRSVSPRWLKWLLMALGVFTLTRYVSLAILTLPTAPHGSWLLRHCWLASIVGLTLPSVFAIDQLLRHPGLSAQRVLLWSSPFLVVLSIILLLSPLSPTADPVVGWSFQLGSGWQMALAIALGAFGGVILTACLALCIKISSWPIRTALLGLVLAYSYLLIDGMIVLLGGWYFRPFLFSEMAALLALWYAFDTAAKLQRATST